MALELPSFSRAPIRLESSLRVIVLLAGLVIIGFGVHASREVIVPLLLAMCLVFAVQPLVEKLERRGVPASLAVTGGMLTLLVGIGLFFATLAYGASELLADLPKYETAAKDLQKSAVGWLSSRGLLRAALAVQGTQVGAFVMSHSGGLLSVVPTLVSHAVFVLLLTLFMLIERNSVKARLLSAANEFAAENRHMIRDVQRYLGTKTLLSVVTGGLVTVICFTLGIANAPLWGAVAFVCNYIPVAGALVSATPPVTLALMSRDVPTIFGLILGLLLVKGAVGNVLEPRMLGNSCGLSPLAVVVAIVVWGALLGPTGALLAVPLTSAFRIVVSHVRDLEWLHLLLTVDAAEVPPSRRVPRPPVIATRTPGEDTLT